MGLPRRTRVGIVGAGPAGLLLARLLHLAGIDCVVLESRDREYVERRQRAGILEQSTVDALRAVGAADRLQREGTPHDGMELRFARRSLRLDFPSLTGGRRVWLYAQTEVVKDLIALQQEQGPPVLFEARALAITCDGDGDGKGNGGSDGGGQALIRYAHAGREHTLACDWVVGCDGYHGVTRHGIPDGVLRTYERAHPYSWFGILADAPPVYDELIYAHSERGFALASMRSARVSRLYLQVPNGTDPEQWPDERVWDELDARLATRRGRRLRRGPITSKAVLPMRSSVTEPMAHGRVFLAGDAAHIVPPTGAKGLNLAVADVVVLGRAFTHLAATGSTRLLDAYSDTCLRRVWRAQHFSNLMTSMLHLSPDQSDFDTRLQLAQLERLATSPHAAAELAANYTGLPVGEDAAAAEAAWDEA